MTNVDNITCLTPSIRPQVFAANQVLIAQVEMIILFLTVSDQQKHPLHKYVDLHCTFDFKAWVEGFCAICSTVHIFDYYASFVSSGPIAMEKSIRELVDKHNIQLLIVPNLYYELAPSFLDELRSIGCSSMIVFFDDSMRFEDTNRFYLSSFDYYLTHDSVDSNALYKPFGIEPIFFPMLPSSSFYDKIIQNLDANMTKRTKDVVFVGAKIADRDLFVNYLKDNGIDIAVYGKGWEAGMLSTEGMIAAYYSSNISLNFIKTIDGSGRIQLKARLFEIIMAGGFILSEYCDELTDYFDIGREIDTFKSTEELLDKVRFYLENSELRDEMSARARDKVEKNYSFESSWSKYLADIEDGRIQSQYPNPGYEVSPVSLNAFLGWNFSIMFGRWSLGQYALAYQQYKFCLGELKGFDYNASVFREFIKWSVRRSKIISSCHFFVWNQIQRIRQGYSRFWRFYINRNIRKKTMHKLRGIKPTCLPEGENNLLEVTNKVYNFIDKQKVSGSDFEYLYSNRANKPTLYSSVYACMTFSLFGKLNNFNTTQKFQWIGYFDSFQNDDGLFYDPVVQNEIYADSDWWGARHLALHMINAYTALGGKPKYKFRFLEEYYDPNFISGWLNAFDWQSSIGQTNDIDNKIMNIGCLLQYQRDTWDDLNAGAAVQFLQRYLFDRINPETGMWGKWSTDDPHQRSRMVQFAYHLFPLFFYDKLKLGHTTLIVNHILKTQNVYGGFGVQANSSACEDIDSIDVLCRLANDVPSLKKEIDVALHRAFKWVLCNQVEDGGFVFRLYEPFTYGHTEMMSEANEGSMFAIWFRSLSLVYMDRYFKPDKLSLINSCPGYEY